jgi:hypothetical protein
MTGAMRRCSDMNATDILNAVQQAAAALRVEGDSLVASNASCLAPELKAAIRQNKPQLITALARPVCAVCGATGDLWHHGEALVHQECVRFLPKPEPAEPTVAYRGVTADPDGVGCSVTIVEIPATGLRYRRTFAHLQLKPPALVDVARWRQCVRDGRLDVGGPVRPPHTTGAAAPVLRQALALRLHRPRLGVAGP